METPITDQQFRELAAKCQDGTATPAEQEAFNNAYHLLSQRHTQWDEELMGNEEVARAQIYQKLLQQAEQYGPAKRTRWIYRYAAAASVLLGLSIGGYFLLHKPKPPQTAQNDPEQIAPVQQGVTLSIGKGKMITLNARHTGQIASLNGANISQQDSILNYMGTTQASTEPEMNTVTNNSGAKFTVSLADGTQATIDVASSLTYPVAFKGMTREVSMTGQAYFKVKHIIGQRFLVKSKGQITEDIGTEFNINAYDDEGTEKTTLVEGSVKVTPLSAGGEGPGVRLKPGQQAVEAGDGLKAVPANLEEVTAWLQGKLIFEKEPLEKILTRVSRIYGVQFVYQDNDVRKLTYGGSVSSTKKLSSVLNFFRQLGGVDFIVEGKTVKVFKSKRK